MTESIRYQRDIARECVFVCAASHLGARARELLDVLERLSAH